MGFSVRASNISCKASERDIYEFFSFSGEITGIETKTDLTTGQVAFVTFSDERALETALLLTGAVIVDSPIMVEVAHGYSPPPRAHSIAKDVQQAHSTSLPQLPASIGTPDLKSAEDVMASLLASGYILGKDALGKAKEFDEKHDILKTASLHAAALKERTLETAATIDKKYDISKKLSETSATVTRSLATVDETYKVSATAREAAAAAEASLSEAGQYVMKNQYVAAGKDWLMGAFGRLGAIAGEVKQQTLAKVQQAEGGGQGNPGGSSGAGAAAGGGDGGGERGGIVGSPLLDDDDDFDGAGKKVAEVADRPASLVDHGPPVVPAAGAAGAGQRGYRVDGPPVTGAATGTAAAPGSLMDDVFSPAPPAASAAAPARVSRGEELPLF